MTVQQIPLERHAMVPTSTVVPASTSCEVLQLRCTLWAAGQATTEDGEACACSSGHLHAAVAVEVLSTTAAACSWLSAGVELGLVR